MSPEAAARSIRSAVDAFASNDDLALAVMLPAVQADLAGQLFVHDIEAGSGVRLHGRSAPYQLRLDGTNFLSMPWPEAIAAFKARGIISDSELTKLLDGYRSRSVEARQLLLEHLRERVLGELEATLFEGGTFRDFAQAIRTEQQTFGIGGADLHYLETVFRTNIQTAYGAGRFRAINDPDVSAARPFWQCRSVQDSRVVPNPCQVLDGKIFRVGNGATNGLYPPNHFNCRCSAVSLDAEEVGSQRVWDDIPPGGDPQSGFGASPAALIARSLIG